MEQGVFMDYQVLYRKYIPHDFDSLVGQEYTKKLLKNSVINNKFAHAYIFTGPRGTGKTSSAKIFAKASDAKALDKNPANVIPICIVAKNLLGFFNIFSICFAFLLPSFTCLSIFASFKDINAISDAAKYAFNKISINLYKPDQDLSKWEEIVCKYNLRSVRFSIVVPNKKLDENFDFYQYFHIF